MSAMVKPAMAGSFLTVFLTEGQEPINGLPTMKRQFPTELP
jgi:hypothetical protein